MAVDTVRFVGDPVAVVVACDRYVARDAADSIVVRAIAPEVGGGFGAKINIYGEEYVAVALSRRLGLPVKWIEDRSEAFLATVHGRDLIPYVELAATRDGKVLGLRMRIIADIGAYNMLLTARVPTHSMTMANATYAFPAVRATLTEVFTNKTPTDAYRGAGRPEATYFVERAMDMLARELGMDPASLRRRNFIQPDQFPYQTQMGAVYDSGDYEKALDRALGVAGWEELTRERDAARADGRLVGLGLSMYVESCGLGPSSTLPPGGLGALAGHRRAGRPDPVCRGRTGRLDAGFRSHPFLSLCCPSDSSAKSVMMWLRFRDPVMLLSSPRVEAPRVRQSPCRMNAAGA